MSGLNQLIFNKANSYREEPTHLEMKNEKERLTINNMGRLFPKLIWNRPSSPGKVPAHLKNSKREN